MSKEKRFSGCRSNSKFITCQTNVNKANVKIGHSLSLWDSNEITQTQRQEGDTTGGGEGNTAWFLEHILGWTKQGKQLFLCNIHRYGMLHL